jgi:hypothetical protein
MPAGPAGNEGGVGLPQSSAAGRQDRRTKRGPSSWRPSSWRPSSWRPSWQPSSLQPSSWPLVMAPCHECPDGKRLLSRALHQGKQSLFAVPTECFRKHAGTAGWSCQRSGRKMSREVWQKFCRNRPAGGDHQPSSDSLRRLFPHRSCACRDNDQDPVEWSAIRSMCVSPPNREAWHVARRSPVRSCRWDF